MGLRWVAGLLGVFSALAQDWPQVRLVRYAEGFKLPTHVAHAGDGSGRLFVVEQEGRIRIVRDGAVVQRTFLDIASRVSCCGERGLLSVAFPPGYASKRHFYVYYTDRLGDIVVSRIRTGSDPDAADPASETILLAVEHRSFGNHNGGQLAFGPDGYLYVGTGDGGGGGDPLNSGQRSGTLLGKLLRLDVESGAATYAIPPANPFAGRFGSRGEIWALGLRNPWRFSFDRQGGDLYIADVGQNLYEEIDHQPASSRGGENYGWNLMEGAHCYQAGCTTTGLTAPVAEYGHGEGCSVTGGFVYRGPRPGRMPGVYFFGDYCTGFLWGLRRDAVGWRMQRLLDTDLAISTFGEDEAGEIYVADHSRGVIYALVEDLPPLTVTAAVNAASFEAGLVPGSIGTVFGSSLGVPAGILSADRFPLPRELGGVAVLVNGTAAPVFNAANVNGREQVSFHVPYELAPGSPASVAVRRGGTTGMTFQVPVLAAQPALFVRDGIAAALHSADYRLVSPSEPAAPGETVLLFATGLGALDGTPGTGNGAPLAPLYRTAAMPEVTAGGRSAEVLFSGLAPGLAGVYQLNVRLPAELPPGPADIVVRIAGAASRPASLPVR